MSEFNSFDRGLFDGSPRSYGPTDITNPFAPQQQPQEAPKETLLKSLTGKSFKVEASNIKGLGTDSTKQNIGPNESNQAALNSIGQDCTKVKADITATIREAQGQVIEATKAVGADPTELFADVRVAPDSGAELLIPAVGSKAHGAGSFFKAIDKTLTAETVNLDIKKKSNEEAMKAIEAELRARSSAPQQDSRADFKATMSADAAPEEQKVSGFDWNRFFDEGHKVEDLMSIDPENPQPNLVPEYAEVCQIEENVIQATEQNDFVEEITDGAKVEGDTTNLRLEVFKMTPEDREEFLAKAELTRQSLEGTSGKLKGMDNNTTSLGRDVKDLLAEMKDAQSKLDLLPPRPERNMTMDMGSMGMVA